MRFINSRFDELPSSPCFLRIYKERASSKLQNSTRQYLFGSRYSLLNWKAYLKPGDQDWDALKILWLYLTKEDQKQISSF